MKPEMGPGMPEMPEMMLRCGWSLPKKPNNAWIAICPDNGIYCSRP